ncbi:MAG: hypothetical protein KAI66_27755 [Lentisphaeria bacterium]|nr:hypothetical protein [Lentisphaeria bacterium]
MMAEALENLDELRKALGELWPVAKGSLSLVRKPCVRPNCKACASGERHPVWLFSFRQAGRRRCMYVPAQLVPTLRRAIENGRKLEALMVDAGAALVRERRDEGAPPPRECAVKC